MKQCLLLLFLTLGFKVIAQVEKPTPIDKIIQGMRGTDTFMVYGDFCSGCIHGNRKRIHVLWKEKGAVWIRSYEYEGRFENVFRTREVPYTKNPFACYEVNKETVDVLIENSGLLPLDTTAIGDGRILVSVGISNGQEQRIYIHYPNYIIETELCCGPYEIYQKKAPLLLDFFSLFPKEVGYNQSFSDNDILINGVTR